MKVVTSLLGAALLLALFLHTASAQDAPPSPDDKRNPELMRNEVPWGMVIVFTEGTTITQANHLRLRYGLTLTSGYHGTDGSWYRYGRTDDSEYLDYAKFYYALSSCSVTPQEGKTICPPITPASAYYEPVSEEVEATLLTEPTVAQLDNRNDPVFFIFKMAKEIIGMIPYIYNRFVVGRQ